MQKLFEEVYIGSLRLKNRLVMAPVGTNFASPDGYVTERLRDYYEERAKGGVGLIIVEVSCIDQPVGKALGRQIAIDDDRFIPGLTQLAQVIKSHGACAAVQLHHAGRAAKSGISGLQPVGPSSIRLPLPGFEPPRELSLGEIEEIIRRFAKAAERAMKAGFDGVEIHAAHLYLIAQFLSSASNTRQDGYGGDLKGRARLLLEVIQAIKGSVGQGYPVWCRINAREYGTESGITVEDAQEVAQMVQNAGADAIHVSAYGSGIHSLIMVPDLPGALVHLAEGIKKVVTIPVIAVGRINTPEIGERVLQEQKADLVAMGRALIADPELPKKTASGRLDDIAPCVACLNCAEKIQWEDGDLECMVNAAVGREREYRISAAEKRKKVIVVGGGPAGMEAARVAALQGHQVLLYEKDQRLGGQLLIAALPPNKGRLDALTNYLAAQVRKLGVDVQLGKEATPAIIQGSKPDVVILATGVTPVTPEISGIDRAQVVTAQDVLSGKAEVGERVIVLGGELVGCEIAAFLAEKGKRVTITRRGPRMAVKVARTYRTVLLDTLASTGVTMLTGVEYEKLTRKGLTITTKEGKRQTIEADTVVLAVGARPNIRLFEALQGMVPEIYLAGDCVEPRRIVEAIHDGSRVARAVG